MTLNSAVRRSVMAGVVSAEKSLLCSRRKCLRREPIKGDMAVGMQRVVQKRTEQGIGSGRCLNYCGTGWKACTTKFTARPMLEGFRPGDTMLGSNYARSNFL